MAISSPFPFKSKQSIQPRALRLPRLWTFWTAVSSKGAIDAIFEMHCRLAEATGGRPLAPFVWTLLKSLITPHPLGGCSMAERPENGVVNHKGEVFGYRNLYVADGSIVPRAIGLNPSNTTAT